MFKENCERAKELGFIQDQESSDDYGATFYLDNYCMIICDDYVRFCEWAITPLPYKTVDEAVKDTLKRTKEFKKVLLSFEKSLQKADNNITHQHLPRSKRKKADEKK